jgi:tRNA pseudouridine synthase 10
VRGIPQTKWDKYSETVEDIIAKPFMSATKGEGHAMHGMGREDIDARCLDWRPFVLEVTSPRKRRINLKKMEKEVNKTEKVMIKDLSISDKKKVIQIKAMRPDKTYRAVVDFTKPLKAGWKEKISSLVGTVNQQTPERVLHRRADVLRKRNVKSIRCKEMNKKRAELEIRGEAGLYVKEFITGDGGRTKPSVSVALNNKAKARELDVIRIHLKGEQHGKIKQRI